MSLLSQSIGLTSSDKSLDEHYVKLIILPERFQSKVSVQENGCWLWTGATHHPIRHPEHKYGVYGQESAHRFAYQTLIGPIPNGMEIDHTCHVKLCVNPDHFEVVTHQVNCARRTRSGPIPGSDEARAAILKGWETRRANLKASAVGA